MLMDPRDAPSIDGLGYIVLFEGVGRNWLLLQYQASEALVLSAFSPSTRILSSLFRCYSPPANVLFVSVDHLFHSTRSADYLNRPFPTDSHKRMCFSQLRSRFHGAKGCEHKKSISQSFSKCARLVAVNQLRLQHSSPSRPCRRPLERSLTVELLVYHRITCNF